MKKLLALCLIAVMAVSMFAGCAPAAVEEPAPAPEAEAEAPEVEEGKEYHIRISCNSGYRGQTFLDAGEILNEQLKAEGSKDTVSVEFIEVEENTQSLPIFHSEGNMPEMVLSSKSDLFSMYKSGFLVPADYIVNDEAYTTHCTEQMRNLLQSYDKSYYVGAVYETEARMMMIYKPALIQLGWSEEQIEAWKKDAREGKVTTDDLMDIAQQVVDNGICEYGILHREKSCSDNTRNIVTFYHGEIPTDEQNRAIINKNHLYDWAAYAQEIVKRGLTPYNLTTDFTSDQLYSDVLPSGKCFAYYGHIEIKSRMMTNAGVSSEYVDENYFSIPNPVTQLGDTPAVGSNPWGIGVTYSSQVDEKMKEYCRRLADVIISTPEIQLDISVRNGHIPVSKAVTEMEEYKADKWMSDLDYVDKYIFAFPENANVTDHLGDSKFWWAVIQEAELTALDPNPRDIKTMVDEAVELIAFDMLEDPGYVIVDWE